MKTVAQLQQELKEAQDRERKASLDQEIAQDKAWSEITANPDNYEWKSYPQASRAWGVGRVSGTQVECRIVPSVLKAWMVNGRSMHSSDWQSPNRWFGMFYYRTDEGILTSNSGGWCVLKVPKLCSDAEWAEILKGNIPAKFHNRPGSF
jgi:hypothetical protein